MGAFTTIFLIFLAQWTYLHATPLADPNKNCNFTDETVSMFLFTREYPQGKDIGIQKCCENIDKSKPIAFLVHGYTSNGNNSEAYNVADQLVQHDYTVFSLDWSEPACSNLWLLAQYSYGNYLEAVNNTRSVGAYAASYVQALMKECGVSLDQITFMGHSLGGHVSGFAGKKIKEMGLGTLPLIVAMDPADPNFRRKTCENRICKEDAKRVVVLHTSKLGLPDPIGHLDLYFNNQTKQPGCSRWADRTYSCSHAKAVEYTGSFMRDNCGFIGVPQIDSRGPVEFPSEDDTNCIYLDSKVLDKDDTKTGSYYVFVDSAAPHCTEKSLSCKI